MDDVGGYVLNWCIGCYSNQYLNREIHERNLYYLE